MLWKNLRTSMLSGVLVWLAYAQVEYLICSVLPLRFEGFTLPVAHWRWTAIVFACYAAAGALCGLLGGTGMTLLKWRRQAKLGPNEAPSVAAFAFVTVYLAWLTVSGTWRGTGMPAAALSLALAIALAGNLKSASESGWRTLLALPWFAPVLLLMPFKIADYGKSKSALTSWAVFLAWTVAVCVGGLVVMRMRRRVGLPDSVLLLRRAVLLGGAAAALFAVSAVYSRGLPPAPPRGALAAGSRPNVLLVIWDTVRADRASVYDYQRDTTPFLRGFARQATLYKNAFSASDMTLSSSASLFTGLYASWHGAHFSRPSPYGRPLDRKFQTIAGVLREQGYSTMAVLANCSYLGTGYQLNKGYQLYDVRTPVGSDAIDHSYYLRGPLHKLLSRVMSAGELDRRFRSADEITEDALKLLGSAPAGGPFFLTLNYMDAHLPYIPPAPYNSLFPGQDSALTFADLQGLRRDVLQQRHSLTPRELAHLTSQYDGSIAFMDAEFAKLVAGLKRLGLYDSTLILLTADHGEALGEKNLMEHAVSVYQNQVHVPLIVKYPAQSQGSVVTAAVSGIDIMPTIFDVAGIGPSKQGQGVSLRQPSESRTVLSESFRSGLLAGWSPRFDRVERAVVRGPVKLIQSTAGRNEMYDLAADPTESANLFRPDHPLAAELGRSLAAIMATAPAAPAPGHTMDKQSLERLRGLGYVQ